MTRIAVALLLALAATGAAHAHEGHDEQVLGTVAAVDEKAVSVKAKDGRTVSIDVDRDTQVLRGDRRVALSDIVVGERAAVSIGTKNGKHVATRIRLAPRGGS